MAPRHSAISQYASQQKQTKLLQLYKLRLAKLQISFHKTAQRTREQYETVTPRNTAQSATLQTRIREALGSNPGWNTNHPDCGLSLLP
jgi:hypothetical protein